MFKSDIIAISAPSLSAQYFICQQEWRSILNKGEKFQMYDQLFHVVEITDKFTHPVEPIVLI